MHNKALESQCIKNDGRGSWIKGSSIILVLLVVIQGWLLRHYFYCEDFYFLSLGRFIEDPWSLFYSDMFHGFWFRPLSFFLIAFNFWISGLNPLGYHLIDLGLHFFNSILVFSLVNLFSHDRKKGIIAGACFAIHPICIQTSIRFTYRVDALGALFCLLTIWYFAKFLLKAENRFYFFSLFFAVLAFLCKETAIILPLLIIAYDQWWGKKRFNSEKAKLVEGVKLYIPFFLLLAVFLGWRWYVLDGWGGYEYQRVTLSKFFPQIFYHLPRLFYYVFHNMIYPNYSIMGEGGDLIFAGFTLIFFLLSILPYRSKILILNNEFSFGLTWILITIIPLATSSHLLKTGGDRFLYLPMAGFCILLTSFLENKFSIRRRISIVLLFLLIVIYFLISIKQNIIWKGKYDENKKIVSSMENFIRENPSRFQPGSIFYFLGMDNYSFFLDVMFKSVLPEFFHKYYFILGDQPTFIWRFKHLEEPESSERISRISESVFLTDERNSMESVNPPDLLTDSITDKNAIFFEYLSQGRFKEITQDLKSLARKREELLRAGEYRKVLTWDFSRNNDFSQWELANQIILSVDQENMGIYSSSLMSTGEDPYLIGPEIMIPSLTVEKIEIRLKLPQLSYLPPPRRNGETFWMTESDATWGGRKHISFPVVADGEFHTYQVPVGSNIYWQKGGIITRLRIDPVTFSTKIQIDYIRVIPYGK